MMKHTRTASYVPTTYTKNSPSMSQMKFRNDIKKNSISGESSKPGKLSQQDLNIGIQASRPINEIMDKKYSPLSIDRKNEFSTNLYQLAKGLDKDKQTYSKLYKTKETQQKRVQKSANRPVDKFNDKLSIYQYVQSKAKRPEDYKIALNVSNQASSRISSRIVVLDEHNESVLNKVADGSLSTKRFSHIAHELTQANKPKTPVTAGKSTPCHQKTPSSIVKGITTSKPSSSHGTKQLNIFQPSNNNLSFNEICEEYSKTPDPRRFEAAPKPSSSSGSHFNDALATKLKIALQGLQGDLQNARHKRGLSSGQAPIFIDQNILQERLQEKEKEREREKEREKERERERERERLQEKEREREREKQREREREREREKIKPIELLIQEPHHEQDEFYEKFFHSDKMTFDFEKLIISQRNKPQNGSTTPTAMTPVNNKPMTAHARTRSIDDPNSLLPTKASSRWNTKRSSIGDDLQAGREKFNLLEQISELDGTNFEKEEIRKYLRG